MPTIDMPVETLCKSPCERGFPTSRWDVARRWQPCVVAGAAALGSEENRRWVSVEWLPGLNASCKFLQFAGNVASSSCRWILFCCVRSGALGVQKCAPVTRLYSRASKMPGFDAVSNCKLSPAVAWPSRILCTQWAGFRRAEA